ncbi:hypothetical protein H310_08697 [Aphanomyces invadans]|uniref:Uncharacterized protein n=1 Tax=Aphanomyces invadans TaxID=157072 RepID=A0A024TX63_9STRA|nr:hypothetical protein H310_08697 [Aphanomyces invadans]ETV98574.1 hypothetical protein H310_08697 [Aphanomyces invadans]|eukprot:XP_008872771.1 hypothetical protein H310_08697 [Aphanomyces invadans]
MTKDEASAGGRAQGKKRKNRNKNAIYVPPGRQGKVSVEDKAESGSAGPAGKKVKRVESVPCPAAPLKPALTTRGSVVTRAAASVTPLPSAVVPTPQLDVATSSAGKKKTKKKKRKKAGTSGDESPALQSTPGNSKLTESPMKVARRLNAAAVGTTTLQRSSTSQATHKTTKPPPPSDEALLPPQAVARKIAVLSTLPTANEGSPNQETTAPLKPVFESPPNGPIESTRSTPGVNPSLRSGVSKSSLAKKRKKANRLAARAVQQGQADLPGMTATSHETSPVPATATSSREPPRPTVTIPALASGRSCAIPVQASASHSSDSELSTKRAMSSFASPIDIMSTSQPLHRLEKAQEGTAPAQSSKISSPVDSTSPDDAIAQTEGGACKATTSPSAPLAASLPKAAVWNEHISGSAVASVVFTVVNSATTTPALPNSVPEPTCGVPTAAAPILEATAIQATMESPVALRADKVMLSPNSEAAPPMSAPARAQVLASHTTESPPGLPTLTDESIVASNTIPSLHSTPTAKSPPAVKSTRTEEPPPAPARRPMPRTHARNQPHSGANTTPSRPAEAHAARQLPLASPRQRPTEERMRELEVQLSAVVTPHEESPPVTPLNESIRLNELASHSILVAPLLRTRRTATTPSASPRSDPRSVEAPSIASSPRAQRTPRSTTDPTQQDHSSCPPVGATPSSIALSRTTPTFSSQDTTATPFRIGGPKAASAAASLFSEPPRMLPNHVPSITPTTSAWTVTSFGTTPSMAANASTHVACPPLSTWFLSSGQANFIRQSYDHAKAKAARASTARAPDLSADEKAFYAKLASSHWRSWYTAASVAPDSVLDPPIPHVPTKVQAKVDSVNATLPSSHGVDPGGRSSSSTPTSFDQMMQAVAHEKAASSSFEHQMIQVLQGKTLTGQSFEEAYRDVLS